jgi:hypothetical protein
MSTPQRNESDVQRLLRTIDCEYTSASLALTGLALGTSMHSFITARLENIEHAREQLVQLVGDPDEATRLVVEQMNMSADKGKS